MTGARRRAELVRDRWGHGTRLAVMIGTGLFLVRVAFALIVPLGGAPDEASHFVKAYASARFDLGTTTGVPLSPPGSDMDRLNQSLGAVYDLGDQAVNPTWACNSIRSDFPASCVDLDAEVLPGPAATSPFGTFQPYLYTVIGLPSLVVSDPDSSMLAMRFVVVLWSSLLVTAALVTLVRRFGTSALMASVVGLTPMVIYTQGTLGTTGVETAAAFAVLAAALDVLWDRGSSPRSSRWLLVASIASLVLCRPLSVAVAAVLAIIVGASIGARETVVRLRDLSRCWRIGLAVVAGGGLVANLGWSLSTPDTYRGQDVGLLSTMSVYAQDTMPLLWREVIGLFEWLDTELPFMILLIAWMAIVAVIIGVFPDRDTAGTARLWFLIGTTVAFGFVVDYTVFARVGGDVQGRHVLPLFQLWTLVAALPNRGGVIDPPLGRARQRRLRWCLLAAGGVLAISVLFVARREAVGTEGPLLFFGEAAWHPQVGWVIPFVVATIGLVIGYVLPAVLASMRSPEAAAESR